MHRGGKKDPRVNLPIPSTMTIHSWKVFTKSCPLLLENDYQLLSFFSFSYLELQFKWPLLDYFHQFPSTLPNLSSPFQILSTPMPNPSYKKFITFSKTTLCLGTYNNSVKIAVDSMQNLLTAASISLSISSLRKRILILLLVIMCPAQTLAFQIVFFLQQLVCI